MERRRFVQQVGLGAAALAAPAWLAAQARARRLTRIGIQAYSVRREIARDLPGTLAALRRMGYTDIEINIHLGMLPTPALRSALDSAGLRASSAHTTADAVLVGWQRHLDAAARMGLEQIVVPDISADARQSLDDWREWADRFNTAGAVAKRHGLTFAFHTEPYVVKAMDGGIPLDVLVERLDPAVVRLELDVGNLAMGGADPVPYVQRYAGRISSLHVKDVPQIGRELDTELGAGVLDIRRILALLPDPEHTLIYVEQEGAREPMESVRKDYAYISALEF